MNKTRLKFAALIGAVLAALTGCGSLDVLEPKPDLSQFHLLESGVPAVRIASLDPEGPVVLIASTSVATHLDRSQIAIVPKPGAVAYSGLHYWGEPLEEGVNRVLKDRIGHGLDSSQVGLLRDSGKFDWEYRVGYRIEKLGGLPGGAVQLRVAWWLEKRGEPGQRYETSIHEANAAAGADDFDAYVHALGAVVAAWGEEVAGAIRSF